MTAEARTCPRCSSEMVLRTAGRGPNVWTAVLGLLDVPEVSRHDPDRGGSSRARLRTRVVGGWKFGAGRVRGAKAAAG